VAASVHAGTPGSGEPVTTMRVPRVPLWWTPGGAAPAGIKGISRCAIRIGDCLVGPGTWKLQDLPSSRLRRHLSRRHVGKGPHAGGGLALGALPRIQLAGWSYGFAGSHAGCPVMACLACTLLKGVPGG
jgi:hypothetical protein